MTRNIANRVAAASLVLLIAAAVSAANDAGWNAARWQTVFAQIPAAPSTLAQAAGTTGSVNDKNGHPALGPTGALAQSRAAYRAGMTATRAAATATAHALQQKMASASQAEKIQIAMSGAAQMSNPDAMRAFAGLETYIMGDGARTVAAARKTMRDNMTRIVAH